MYIRLTFAVALCLIFLYQIEAKPAFSDEILSDLINLEKALVKRKLSLVTRDGGLGDPSAEQPAQGGDQGNPSAEQNAGENPPSGKKDSDNEFEKEIAPLIKEIEIMGKKIEEDFNNGDYYRAAQWIKALRSMLIRFALHIENEAEKGIQALRQEIKGHLNKMDEGCRYANKNLDPEEQVACYQKDDDDAEYPPNVGGGGAGHGEGKPHGEGEGEGKPPGQGEGEGKPPGQEEGEGKPPGQGEGEGEGEGEGKPPGQGEGEGEGEGKPPGQGEGEGENKPPGQGKGEGEGEGKSSGQGEGEEEGKPPGEGEGEGEGKPPGQGEGEGKPPGEGEGEGEGKPPGDGVGKPPGQGEGEDGATRQLAERLLSYVRKLASRQK